MNSCELVAYISSIACTIYKTCNKDDIAIMAAAFTQLGDSLATMLTHEEICCNKDEDIF